MTEIIKQFGGFEFGYWNLFVIWNLNFGILLAT